MATSGEVGGISTPGWCGVVLEDCTLGRCARIDPELQRIQAAIAEVEEAVKTDDVDDINAKVETLMQASHKLAEQMYAQSQDQEGAPETAAEDDNVVDAEFEEVKEDDVADENVGNNDKDA